MESGCVDLGLGLSRSKDLASVVWVSDAGVVELRAGEKSSGSSRNDMLKKDRLCMPGFYEGSTPSNKLTSC